MTRKEAIDKVYGMSGTKEQHEALEFLIPEVRELREFYERQSEDERIIRTIIDALYSHTNSINLLSSRGYQMEDIEVWFEKQKENSKLEDSWHKVADSFPDSTREVICKDAIGNFFIGRYYKGSNSWEVSMYDDINKSNEDNPPVVMWCDIPSEKQKERKPIKMEVYEVGKGTTVCGQDYKCKKDYKKGNCWYIKDVIYHCGRDGYLTDQNGVSWSCTPEWFKEYIQSNAEWAEEEKNLFVSGQFLQCKLSFDEFKEGEHYWLEYVGGDMYVGRSDNILNQKFHITPRQLYTLFSQQLEEKQKEQKPAEWSEEDKKRVKQLIYDTEHIRAEYEKRKKELGESFNDELIKDCDEQIAWLKDIFLNHKKFTEAVDKLWSNEWSEEDKRMLSRCIKSVECSKQFADSETYKAAKDVEINWLEFLPKRKNLLPKQEWNEEDEEIIYSLRSFLILAKQSGRYDSIQIAQIERCLNWLKSLRPQKLDASKLENFDPVDVLNRIKTEWPMAWEKVVGKQEWSEEDEKKLERVDDLLWMLDDYISDDCSICEERTARLRDEIHNELFPWLEFLRPQYHGDVTMTEVYKMGLEAGKASSWKPSEKQTNNVIVELTRIELGDIINGLYYLKEKYYEDCKEHNGTATMGLSDEFKFYFKRFNEVLDLYTRLHKLEKERYGTTTDGYYYE